jgi:hypothetical protein
MTRPRRIYQEGGHYYYIEGGAKKKIKVPDGISQRQLQKINIKNIINLAERRRVKRRKKPVNVRYGKKIVSQMEKEPSPEVPSLSTYLFKPKLAIKTLSELAQSEVDTNVDKLANQLLARLQPVVTPPTVPLPATIPTLPQSLGGVSTSIPPAPPGTPAVNLFPEGEAPTTPQAQVRSAENRQAPSSAPQAGTATPITRSSTFAQRAREALGIRPAGVAPAPPAPGQIQAQAREAMPGNKYSLSKQQNRALVLEVMNELLAEDPSIREISDANYDSVKDRLMAKISARINRPANEISRPNKNTLTEILTDARVSSGSSGRGHGQEDGLYNDEIEEIARRSIKNFVPVIASDEINTLSKYVKPGQKRFAFIINTNPSTSDGSGEDGQRPGHWRAVYINNDDDFPTVEYFDPLCEGRIPNDLLKVCMKIARKMNPEMMFKYKQNMLQRQSKLSSSCGYHSLGFIEDRYNGVPYSEATGYDDYMMKLNQVKDDSRDGEKDVMKYIKKYDSYI